MFEPEHAEIEQYEESCRMAGLVAAIVMSIYGAACGWIGWLARDYFFG